MCIRDRVKPDTVSNRASTGWLIDPVSRKGTAPMTLSATHPRAVVTNPCLLYTSPKARRARRRPNGFGT